MSELNRFLDQRRSKGQARQDSEGFFTLDQSRALEQLRQYQLVSPHEYILNLLASAVAAGASYVNLEHSMRSLVIERDGCAFQFEQLANLFSAVLVNQNSKESTALRELAVGLNGLLHFRPRFIQVVSTGPEGSVRMKLTLHQLTVEKLAEKVQRCDFQGFGIDEEDPSRTFIEAEGLSRQPLDLLKTVIGESQEISLVRTRANKNRLRFKLNGKRQKLATHLGDPLLVSRSESEREPPYRWTPPLQTVREELEGAQDFWIGLFPEPENQVEAIINGISYPIELGDDVWGVRAILEEPPLIKDISGAGLVRNDNYTQLKAALEARVEEMVNLLLNDLKKLTGEALFGATELLDRYAIHRLRNWKTDQAEQLWTEIRRVRLQAKPGPSKWSQWSRFYRDNDVLKEAQFCEKHFI